MYLILDFGNTRIKHFVYSGKALVASKVSVFSDLPESLNKTKQEFPKITAILIAVSYTHLTLPTIYSV